MLLGIVGLRAATERLAAMNLRKFDAHKWSCLVFAMDKPADPLFQERCSVRPYRNETFYTALLRLPHEYEHVAVLLDDVRLRSDFDVSAFMRTVRASAVDVASPAVHGSTFRHMRSGPLAVSPVAFVEVFFAVYSRAAWSCVRGLVGIAAQCGLTQGWGMDLCLPAYCATRPQHALLAGYAGQHTRRRSRLAHRRAHLEAKRLSAEIRRLNGTACMDGRRYI